MLSLPCLLHFCLFLFVTHSLLVCSWLARCRATANSSCIFRRLHGHRLGRLLSVQGFIGCLSWCKLRSRLLERARLLRVWVRIHQDSLSLVDGLDSVGRRVASFVGRVVVWLHFLVLRLFILQIVLHILVPGILHAVRMILLIGVLLPVHARVARRWLRVHVRLDRHNIRLHRRRRLRRSGLIQLPDSLGR